MGNKKSYSIKDIARLSGVSVATVSRVINHNGRFSEETRRRVEGVIEQCHYMPNMSGKNLRENRTDTIGMLIPDITNEFFAGIAQEVENYFYKHGYSVLICNTNEEQSKESAYFKAMQAKRVEGIVCISGSHAIPAGVIEQGIPIVCIDRKPGADGHIPLVASDHYLGGYIATEHLIERGCQNIIILSKRDAFSNDIQRLEGYRRALQDYHLPVKEDNIIRLGDDAVNFDEARSIVFYLVKKGHRFDGVFATNDWRAYGALVALQQTGVPVPGQVKIIGFDDSSVSKCCYPAITTIRQNKRELALQASRQLLQMMAAKEGAQALDMTIPVNLVERGTT